MTSNKITNQPVTYNSNTQSPYSGNVDQTNSDKASLFVKNKDINRTQGSPLLNFLDRSGVDINFTSTTTNQSVKTETTPPPNVVTEEDISEITNETSEPMIAGSNSVLGRTQTSWMEALLELESSNRYDVNEKKRLEDIYTDALLQTIENNKEDLVPSKRVVDFINGNSLVKNLGENFNLESISEQVENGGICSVGTGKNAKLYINDNGTAYPLKISQEKLEELFPPIETATFYQPVNTSVCTIVAKLNAMLDTPIGRVNLFTLLEEKGDDIVVNLRGNKAPVVFKGGKPVSMNSNNKKVELLSGKAPGIEILEQAILVDRIRDAENIPNNTDIKSFSISRILKEGNTVAEENTTSIPLLGKKGKFRVTPAGVASHLENKYVANQDMMTASWDNHARSIVDYDKVNKVVTYHDPACPGFDIKESLTDFIAHKDLQTCLYKAEDFSLTQKGNSEQ